MRRNLRVGMLVVQCRYTTIRIGVAPAISVRVSFLAVWRDNATTITKHRVGENEHENYYLDVPRGV